MVSPKPFEAVDLAKRIVMLYVDAELRIMRITSRNIARGIAQPQWAVIQAGRLAVVRSQMQTLVAQLERQSSAQLTAVVTEAYQRGNIQALAQIAGVDIPTIVSGQKVTALVREAHTKLGSTHFAILRQTEDVYRSVVARASAQSVVGVETRRKVAQQALNQFANRGVTGFVDRAGRSWDLPSYAEMATRTTTARASIQGHTDRLQSNGYDLVIVSAHWESCDRCDPFEGQTLSLSRAPGYTSLGEAISAGLYHPNCKHSHAAYVSGMTRPNTPPVDYEDRQARYEATQDQRYNERGIRQWKRREAVAITDQERARAHAKVREWQARQKEHVDSWNLRRKYERESITSAR